VKEYISSVIPHQKRLAVTLIYTINNLSLVTANKTLSFHTP